MTLNIDKLFQEALDAHVRGDLSNAKAAYEQILREFGEHAEALHHLGLVNLQLGRVAQAVRLISHSIEVDGANATALSNLAHCLNMVGRNDEAIVACERALKLGANDPAVWSNRANALRASGRAIESEESIRNALRLEPSNPVYIYNLAIALYDQGRYHEAKSELSQSLTAGNRSPELFNNLAACHVKLNDPDCACEHAKTAINLRPDFADAWATLGAAFYMKGEYSEALVCQDKVLSLRPPTPKAHIARSMTLNRQRRMHEALREANHATSMDCNYAEGWSAIAEHLIMLKKYSEALESSDRAIELNPKMATAWYLKAEALDKLHKYRSAIEALYTAVSLSKDEDTGLGALISCKLKICDWTGIEPILDRLRYEVEGKRLSISPFSALGVFDSVSTIQSVAQTYVEKKYSRLTKQLVSTWPIATSRKIRIGYFSSNFHSHAMMYLMAELFTLHNRNAFEVHGFSFGPNINDRIRQRVQVAMDRFYEVSSLSDKDLIRFARNKEIDIAIDIVGHTEDSRPMLFISRVAPIQVNYLGYPGTSALPNMDYLIADRTVIPETHRKFYSEKIIYLPNCYQVNDSTRTKSDRSITREQNNLPLDAFVFCCFNNTWKIMPDIFKIWMSILREVRGSVIWLLTDSEDARENLAMEATNAGVEPKRLVFAKRLPMDDHLARHQLADLFLDTLPYGAHTTASDSLWSGLPVLTVRGNSFASRVASSLLENVGLPELIAEDLRSYERLAVELGRDKTTVEYLRRKLKENLTAYPLYDTRTFTRNIEHAYMKMVDRHRNGLDPETFSLADTNSG